MNVLLITLPNRPDYIPLDSGYSIAYYNRCSKNKNVNFITISRENKLSEMYKIIQKNNPKNIIFFIDNVLSTKIFALNYALKLSLLAKRYDGSIHFYIQSYKINKNHSYEILIKNKQLDGIIRGEPEKTIFELLERYNIKEILGLSFRFNKNIIINQDRPLIENLDEIPSPFLSNSIPIELFKKYKFTFMSTSRGCHYNCYYCFRNVKFSKVRHFSMQRIIGELEYLKKQCIKKVFFIDDCFIVNQQRFEQIIDNISQIDDGKQLKFSLMCRYEFLTLRNIELLRKVNIDFIQLGLQTLNRDILRNLNRKFDIIKFDKAINRLKKAKINVKVDLILGLPGDNFVGFKKSLDYLISVKPQQIRIHTLFIPPNTFLYKNISKLRINLYNNNPDIFLPKVKSNYSFSYFDMMKARRYIQLKRKNNNIFMSK